MGRVGSEVEKLGVSKRVLQQSIAGCSLGIAPCNEHCSHHLRLQWPARRRLKYGYQYYMCLTPNETVDVHVKDETPYFPVCRRVLRSQ